MRFRAKFQWLQMVAAIIWIGLSYAWIHKSSADPALRSTYLITGIIWLCVGILNMGSYFTWWEIGEDSLVQRRLLSVRRIPWNEVTRIGPWQPGKRPMSQYVEVDYARPAPLSERGSLLLWLEDRDLLVRALCAHAPQADFEPFPFKG